MYRPFRIIFYRHGQSTGNVNNGQYLKGDSSVGLTKKGWQQSINLGQFIAGRYKQSGTAPEAVKVFCSPYMRSRQTLSGVNHAINHHLQAEINDISYRPHLIERSFGLLPFLKTATKESKDPSERLIAHTLLKFSFQLHKASAFVAQPPLGDSPKMISAHIQKFIEDDLEPALKSGAGELQISAHGAVIRAFQFNLFDLTDEQWRDIRSPGNCDAYELTGQISHEGMKNLTFRQVYEGAWQDPKTAIYGRAVDKDPLDKIDLNRTNKLPPVPKDFRL